MTRKEIFPHELIGETIEVIASKNKSNLGIKGKIIDETKETITVIKYNGTKSNKNTPDDGKTVVLMKQIITIKLMKSGKILPGEVIAKRPEDRLKG